MSLVSLVLLLVLVGVIVRGFAREPLPPIRPGDDGEARRRIEEIQEELERVNTRLHRLEEERDFYKALLESPNRSKLLDEPEDPADHRS